MQAIEFEREALHRLPAILAELFDEPKPSHPVRIDSADRGVDTVVDVGGRRWLVQIKSSSGPGVIAAVAPQLAGSDDEDGLAVLVVPYMTPAGARVADERHVNPER